MLFFLMEKVPKTETAALIPGGGTKYKWDLRKIKKIQIIVDINLKREVIFLLIFIVPRGEKAEQHKTRIEITKKLGGII